MVLGTSCEGSASRHAGIDVELKWDPAVLMNDESAISSGEEPIEPGQVLLELSGEDERPLIWPLPESVQHSVEEQASLWADLSYIHHGSLPRSMRRSRRVAMSLDDHYGPASGSLTAC